MSSKHHRSSTHGFLVEIHSAEELGKFKSTAAQIRAFFPSKHFRLMALDGHSENTEGFKEIDQCLDWIDLGRRDYLLAIWQSSEAPART
jgi:hypothetical protein